MNADDDAKAGRPKKLASSAGQPVAAYDLEYELRGTTPSTRSIFMTLREQILALGGDVEERFLKLYVSYRHTTNFCEVVPQKGSLVVYLDALALDDPKHKLRNLKGIGHWGTGLWDLRLTTTEDLPYVADLVRQSYAKTK